MKPMPPLTVGTALAFLLVLGSAAGARVWYVMTCSANAELHPALSVQDPPVECAALIGNVSSEQRFACKAPLAEAEESTAHVAPLYPLMCGLLESQADQSDVILRWLQCALGSLTAACYFLFARRAFHCTIVATLAGLLAAVHPFWIINAAELNDGALATFLVGLSLALGARGGQTGGPVTGIFFGLALAGVALTRAALLPFAVVALLWFLWECRRFSFGWFAGFLAILGFVNGLAPWAIRNWQTFQHPVPITTSTYLHLWMGNNPVGVLSTTDADALKATLPEKRWNELKAEPNQAKRYNSLAYDVWEEVREHPVRAITRRIEMVLAFFLGDGWLKTRTTARYLEPSDIVAEPPEWVTDHFDKILQATLLGMGALGFLGWRFSHAWRRYGRIGTIAMLFIPLPYILGHAEMLSGPRLPLDGVILCMAAYALASFVPGLTSPPRTQAESPA